MSMVIGSDCTGSCKSNYLMIMATTAPGKMRLFVSTTNKTDSHNIAEILLKVALNTITLASIIQHLQFCMRNQILCLQIKNLIWKLEYPEKTTELSSQVTDKLYHVMLY
jgi:hypothetical protein